MIQTRIRFVSEIYALNALWALAMLSTRCAHPSTNVHIGDLQTDALNPLRSCTTCWGHFRDVHNALRASPMPTTRWGHIFRSQSEFGFGVLALDLREEKAGIRSGSIYESTRTRTVIGLADRCSFNIHCMHTGQMSSAKRRSRPGRQQYRLIADDTLCWICATKALFT